MLPTDSSIRAPHIAAVVDAGHHRRRRAVVHPPAGSAGAASCRDVRELDEHHHERAGHAQLGNPRREAFRRPTNKAAAPHQVLDEGLQDLHGHDFSGRGPSEQGVFTRP